VLQDSQPEPELTARECLALYAGYYTHPRPVDDTLARVGLADLADRRCEQLSGGQRRRVDVALALIGDPELLFLGEPTTGFDPAARRAMWDLVQGLRTSGTTIVLTTPYMEEAERLADRIAVIAEGQIVAEGTPGSLGPRNLMAAEISFTVPSGVRLQQMPVRLRRDRHRRQREGARQVRGPGVGDVLAHLGEIERLRRLRPVVTSAMSPHQGRRRDCCLIWPAAQSGSYGAARFGGRRAWSFVRIQQ
jgi:ABC-type multidrug transport system ATPase subunit